MQGNSMIRKWRRNFPHQHLFKNMRTKPCFSIFLFICWTPVKWNANKFIEAMMHDAPHIIIFNRQRTNWYEWTNGNYYNLCVLDARSRGGWRRNEAEEEEEADKNKRFCNPFVARIWQLRLRSGSVCLNRVLVLCLWFATMRALPHTPNPNTWLSYQ